MNQSLKIMLAGLLMCIVTHGLMLFINLYFLIHLGDWTMAISNKYLLIDWTVLDRNLVRWFPFFVGVMCAISRVKKIQILAKHVLWTLLSVIGFILLGIIIALLTWTSKGADSQLLPESLKHQPFANYWTVFIGIGILLGLMPIVLRRKDNIKKS